MPTLYKTYSGNARAFCNLYTARIAMSSVMTNPSDRLRQARIRKGFEQAIDASVAYGWNRNTYASNENGNAPFSFKSAQKYARAFGVRAEWLYSGSGAMVDEAADDDLLPSESDLEQMVALALQEVPAGSRLADYPPIVASSLRDQLRLYLKHGGFQGSSDAGTAPDTILPPSSPTRQGGREARRTP